MAFGNDWRQIWAIIRRYGIIVSRNPIKNFLKMLVWPSLLIGFLVLTLHKLIEAEPTKRDAITQSFIQLAPRFAMMTTIFHVGYHGESLIKDKATGMKSLMISSGLKRRNYYFANSICWLFYLLPISLAMAAVTKVYLVDETMTWFSLIALLGLSALHLDAFISFMVSFITSPSYVIIIQIILFFESVISLLADLLIRHIGEGAAPVILFLASMSPFEPLRLFYDRYLADHSKMFERQDPLPAQDEYLIFSAQIVAIILLRLFACWFEEVCPWQVFSAPRGACFCLNKEEERYSDELIEESVARDNPLFEQTNSRHKEIGITVSKATKSFKSVTAVKNVTFTVFKGEATLLLGHNGAGKSTLMNMILGLLQPDGGRVRIRSSGGTVNSVGICPQASVLDESLDVRQHLELFNDIKSNLSGGERKRHVQRTLTDINLAEVDRKLPQELSGGMKRKLSLGIALVGKSEVLILDEPSSGLDPDSRNFIWNAIRRYRRGRTVLLSTQHMEEADYLGDRIAIMSAGQIVCCGSPIFLNKIFGAGYKLRVECMRSKREQVLQHIRSHFKDARLVEGDDVVTRVTPSDRDVSLDFVVELKSCEDEAKAELQLIQLLEDLENNKEQIGVLSYGLKSSSIEDVMLRTGRMFENVENEDETRLAIKPATHTHLKAITRTQASFTHESRFETGLGKVSALCIKHLHTYRANLFTVLIMKLLLPVLSAFNAINEARKPTSMDAYWQSPVHALMIGHFIYFPIKERLSKFKIMQLDTNLGSRLYWLSFFLVDLAAVLVSAISINIFLAVWLDTEVIVPKWQLHGVVTAATLLFCLASMMFCYLFSNIISDAKTAYGYVVILFGLSTVAYIIVYLLRLAFFDGGKSWIQNFFGYVGLAFLPNDALSQVFIGLSSECYLAHRSNNRTCVPSEGFSPVALGWITLTGQALIYAMLLCLVEGQILNLEYYLRFETIFGRFYKKQAKSLESAEIDEDVQKESVKAKSLISTPLVGASRLVAAGLHKSYSRSIKVIRDLSFTVQKGECFGLLGVNGAGKSTTFSMLCGESRPDAGRILADGDHLDSDLDRYREKFGYDPQSSPDMSLTAHQALRLMARLRGVRESQIELQLHAILGLLSMSEHEHKLDSELSGGTKRKLTLGMALIGSPRLLALDEPTAGVDPLARRGVWQLLKMLRSQNDVSIIISSHAMEECEAICDRITIMARGRLRCIGTFLHLRSKFAKGCSLRVVFSASSLSRSDGRGGAQDGRSEGRDGRSIGRVEGVSPNVIHELQEMLSTAIGRSSFKLADKNSNSITFDIIDNRVRRSILFRTMRDFRLKHPSCSYSINDSSLEDIFLSLAKEQQKIEKRQSL